MRATVLLVSAMLLSPVLAMAASEFTSPNQGDVTTSPAPAADQLVPSLQAVALKSGGRAEDPAFSVWLEGPDEVAVGKPSKAQARVVAKEPYKCNAQYPAKFVWDSKAGVSVDSNKVVGMTVDGKSGILALPFSADRPGPVTLSGTLSFSVCTKENCRMEKRKLELPIKAVPQG